jgi:hypothetical protein
MFAVRLKIEHGVCASVRAGFTVVSDQTNALERVLQAPAQYSICGCGEYAASTTPSWSLLDCLKALEPHLSRLLRVKEGKWCL